MNEQIGIDFGTTTSAVCRCTYETDRVQGVQEYVPFNGELYDRTAVLVTGTLTNGFGETVRSDEEKYGWTAWEDTGKYPLLESGFKMDLLSPDSRRREQARILTKKYFGHLYQKYTENQVRKKDGKTEKITTVVTYPAKFSGELQAFLKEAAEEAGFANVLLVNEAQAAMQYALHFDSGETAAFFRNNRKQVLKVMLIDMGAGTTDIAVFEYDTQEPSQVKTIAFYPKQGGYNFGGGEIDQKLYEFYVSKLGADYPADYSNDGDAALGERLLKENIKQHKEQHLSRQLQEKQTVSAPMDLMRDARRSPEKPDLRLDREGFEMLLKDCLPQFSALVNGALEEAMLTGEEIDLVLLTGGHSQWYFVKEMLLNRMDFQAREPEYQVKLQLTADQILTFPQPHLVVAKGAAVIDPNVKNSTLLGVADNKNLHVLKVCKAGKYGLMDTKGRTISLCKWDDIFTVEIIRPYEPREKTRSYCEVKKENKFGIINRNGKLVIPCQYERICFAETEELWIVKKDGKCGCIDSGGNEIVPCGQYEYIGLFSEGLAKVKLDGKYGYIDHTGKLVISCQWDGCDAFSDGLAKVELEGKAGYIDRTGKLVIPFQWWCGDFQRFSDGLAIRTKGFWLRHGFIDKAGREVIPCQWSDAEPFHEGMARVTKHEKHGYIDKTGRLVVPRQWYEASDFSEGLACVGYNGNSTGYIDKTGNMVIPQMWWSGTKFQNGIAKVKYDPRPEDACTGGGSIWADDYYIDKAGNVMRPNDFEALIRVYQKGKFGYMDKNKKLIVPYQWQSAEAFSEGLASVRKDGLSGYIDISGKMVIPYQWEYSRDFSNGRAVVEQDGKYGFIDTTGKLVIPCHWDSVKDFNEGLATVRKNGKYGCIDIMGNVVIPCIWDRILQVDE